MNCYYQDRVLDFLNRDANTILEKLAKEGGNDPMQMEAWNEEIAVMQSVLRPYQNEITDVLFEYTIPRLAKRVDVVLLLRGMIFVLEFKVGEKVFRQGDVEQVMDYALDLKNFHKESHSRTIVPMLIATKAKDEKQQLRMSVYDDDVYNPILVGSDGLGDLIAKVIDHKKRSEFTTEEIEQWHKSRYEPTPTIIETASALYLNHSVEEITRSDASGESLRRTTGYLLDVIEQSRRERQKSICFVTGVPGAGKTLVGLNVAIEQSKRCPNDLAVYLSGNGPLVKVLTAALARDKVAQHKAVGEKCKLEDAKREVGSFIQGIHNYREQMLNKLKLPIVDGELEIDEQASVAEGRAGHAEIEHIAIFDEAQRAWNHQKLADWLALGGSYGNKKKVPDFPVSEAEFLIWSLNLRRDWAVIICLVGGGQEIHTGEAGIGEWLRALGESFPDWNVYVSDRLEDKEYAEGNVSGLLAGHERVEYNAELHLAASMRSFRTENLSLLVHRLLASDADGARAIYDEIRSKYPIVLTRDPQAAKLWLKQQARGSERYGMIASSHAARLRPLAIDVKRKVDVEHWFLDDKEDLRSSFFLEDVATEFDVQGLELDWTCVAWDGDLRHTGGQWEYYNFSHNQWQRNRNEVNRAYQLNAYRVLLTRARQGMALLVPHGDVEDETRTPRIYDGIFEYLRSIGFEVI